MNTVKTQSRGLANGHYPLIPLLFWILAGIAGCSGGGSGGSTPKTPLGTATITGTVQYQDKEYGVTGFTGNLPAKAVRYALIEVVDPSDGAVLGSTRTGSTGQYSATFTFYGDTAYVRVISDARITGGNPVKVQNLSGALYAVRGLDVTASSGAALTANITVNASGAGGAFNILDALTSGFEFVYSLSGTYPPTLLAFWQENSAEGTYYCTGCPSPGDGIYVTGNLGGDTDGYDDDVIWHEFGHFVADKFSKDDSPGGQHYLTGNDQDLRLSWSEGWGNFFTGAVKKWLTDTNFALLSTAAMPASRYVDTVNASVGISIDIANPVLSGYGDVFLYSSSELAVAKVLWHVMTGTGNFGMQPIWNVVSSSQFKATTPVNLETFWDGWRSQRNPNAAELTALKTILRDRRIYYEEDSWESGDDVFATATVMTVGTTTLPHYLYKSDGSNDIDIFAINNDIANKQYTVTTNALTNGADTFIRIYGPATTYALITSNDNSSGLSYYPQPNNCDSQGICRENTQTLLASRTTFTTGSGGAYYIEVTTNTVNRPLSAGRYGAYTLTITSP